MKKGKFVIGHVPWRLSCMARHRHSCKATFEVTGCLNCMKAEGTISDSQLPCKLLCLAILSNSLFYSFCTINNCHICQIIVTHLKITNYDHESGINEQPTNNVTNNLYGNITSSLVNFSHQCDFTHAHDTRCVQCTLKRFWPYLEIWTVLLAFVDITSIKISHKE